MTTERRKGERHFLGGHETPYSKGLMARALTAVGVTEEAAYELARRTEADLAQRGEVTVDLDRLAELAVDLLGDERGRRAVRQLRRYRDLQELDLPVILLVGGGTAPASRPSRPRSPTGSGSRGSPRPTSFGRRCAPSSRRSSCRRSTTPASGTPRPDEGGGGGESGNAALLGFLDQTRNVLTGVEAALQRALDEGWSMVLEGVHLVPGMISTELRGGARRPLRARDPRRGDPPHPLLDPRPPLRGRPALDRYLAGLPEIRSIQEYVLERAARNDVPVVENESQREAVRAVMDLVLAQAERVAEGVAR